MTFILPKIRPDELLAGYRARIASWNGCSTSTELAGALAQAFPEHACHDKTLDFIQIAARHNGLTPAQLMRRHSCRHVLIGLALGNESFKSLRSMSVSWSFALYSRDQRVRACPECIAEDREQQSYAYWRRSHQVPGLYACPRHGCDLVLSEALDMPAAWPDEALALPAPFSRDERLAQDRNRHVQTAIAILRQLVEQGLVIQSDTLALAHYLSQLMNGKVSSAALARLVQERVGSAWIRYVLTRGESVDRCLIHRCLVPGRWTSYMAVAMVASVAFESAHQALMHLGAKPLRGDAEDQALMPRSRTPPTHHDTLATT